MFVIYGDYDVIDQNNMWAIDIHDGWVTLFQGDT